MKIYRGTYPRSSELYHHGILGQKWGVRRFQNPDGSLTAEGRERYGSGNSGSTGERIKTGARHVGNAIGKAAKATGKAVGKAAVVAAKAGVRRLKETHPWLMTNDELAEYTKRLTAEKTVSEMRKSIRGNNGSNARKVIGNILENGAKTLTDAGFKKIANSIMTPKTDKEINKIKNQVEKSKQENALKQERRNTAIINAYETIASNKATAEAKEDAFEVLRRYNDPLNYFGQGNRYNNLELPKYGEGKKK